MTLFEYTAINSKGKKTKGVLDAKNIQQVQTKLFEENLTPTAICQIRKKRISKRIKKSEILHFTRELSRLLLASLPLYDSLLALEEKYRSDKIHPMIIDLCDQIKKGVSFSQGLKNYSHIFNPLYQSMIANSEKTGNLAKVLEQVAILMDKELAVKAKLTSAMIYPCILVGFCFIVLTSLFFYVIPSLSDLFEGRNVHIYTKIVLNMSLFLNEHAKVFIFSLIAFVLFAILCYSVKSLKIIFYKIISKSWMVGKIMQKTALIRYCRSLSSLLKGGVPFVEALALSRKVMNHPLLESIFEKIDGKVIQGKSFATLLQKTNVVPPIMSRMVAIAEQSGKMPYMLEQIAEIEEEDLAKNLTLLTSVAQPVILLILGTVVGLVLLAVLLPLTDVSSFMSY